MKLKFIPAEYNLDFKIPDNFIDTLQKTFKKNSNLIVFSAVNFRHILDDLLKIVEENGFKTHLTKAFRTSKVGQILGCDSYEDSLNFDLSKVDGFVYLGDGYFHPNALLLAQEYNNKIKPVVICDIVNRQTQILDENHISKYFKKRKGNFLKFHTSKNIGVFITTKWGQSYLDSALKLKEKYPDKNFYFFIGDNFNDNEMENFPFCEMWINSACPRIGQDDVIRHKKPVLNIKDIWEINKNE